MEEVAQLQLQGIFLPVRAYSTKPQKHSKVGFQPPLWHSLVKWLSRRGRGRACLAPRRTHTSGSCASCIFSQATQLFYHHSYFPPSNIMGMAQDWTGCVSSFNGWAGCPVAREYASWPQSWAKGQGGLGWLCECDLSSGGIPRPGPSHICLCVVQLTLKQIGCVFWQGFIAGLWRDDFIKKICNIKLWHLSCLPWICIWHIWFHQNKQVHMKCIYVGHVIQLVEIWLPLL